MQTLFNGVSHAAVSVVGPNQAAEWDEAYETRDSIYSYNPEKAKQLLKQAGYGEGDLTYSADAEWLYDGFPDRKKLARSG